MPERSMSGVGAVRTIGASVCQMVRGKAAAMSARVTRIAECSLHMIGQFLLKAALVELRILEGQREVAQRRVRVIQGSAR